jgi:thymidine kinase
MWGGKTEALISRLTRAHLQGVPVIAFNPSVNQRGPSDRITTHSGASFPAHSVADGGELLEHAEEAEVVGIDEIFLLPGGVAAVRELMNQRKKVVVATLDMDSEGRVWESVAELLGLAEEVVKCPAVCAVCKKDAYYTFRRGDAPPERVLVGAGEWFEPRCLPCWTQGQDEKRAALGPGSLFGEWD